MAVITGESTGLESFGFGPARRVTRNLTAAALFEESIRRREGIAAAAGPLVVRTGKHTGRSPQDKFFVREASSEQHVDWGKTNKAISQDAFDALLARVDEYLREKDVFVLDAFAGADARYRLLVLPCLGGRVRSLTRAPGPRMRQTAQMPRQTRCGPSQFSLHRG